MEYNFREIEKKWHQKWVRTRPIKVVEMKTKEFMYQHVSPIHREQACMWAIPGLYQPATSAHRYKRLNQIQH